MSTVTSTSVLFGAGSDWERQRRGQSLDGLVENIERLSNGGIKGNSDKHNDSIAYALFKRKRERETEEKLASLQIIRGDPHWNLFLMCS